MIKGIKISIILFFIFIVVAIIFFYIFSIDKEITTHFSDEEIYSFYLEQPDGTYKGYNEEDFPPFYLFNSEKSYCTYGSKLSWENDELKIASEGEDKCYIYLNTDSFKQNFSYTGTTQTFVAPFDGMYRFETWGAAGGDNSSVEGGDAAYTSGNIYLNRGDTFYVQVGYGPRPNEEVTNVYNGGSTYHTNASALVYYSAGGAATDFRLVGGSWSDTTSLNSRIMVSAGGGGATHYIMPLAGAHAGGLTGYSGQTYDVLNGLQLSINGVANQTGSIAVRNDAWPDDPVNRNGFFGYSDKAAASSGYYSAPSYFALNKLYSGYSGTSFISGHTGSVAITSENNQAPISGCTTGTTDNNCSHHYSGYVFSDTIMIDGAGYNWTNVKGGLVQMPSPYGGLYSLGNGHNGDGFARVTYLEK